MNHAATYRGQRGEYSLDAPSPFAFGRASACFRALDSTGTKVCLKEFTQAPLGDSSHEGTSEFLAEVAARARVVHPNILPILDHGSVLRGQRAIPFIVMPLCDHDLRTSMRGHQFVPLGAAMNSLRQIAGAIDFAHAAGLIHGDIKPENILFVRSSGHVYLSDFGTSRFFAYNEAMVTATRNAAAGGTTAYLSPEQIEFNKQSARSDIYSFSSVAFEMLAGGLPVDPALPPFRQMQAKVTGKLRDARELNPGLGEKTVGWLAAGLALDPASRPGTAVELCAGLESNTYFRVPPGPVLGDSGKNAKQPGGAPEGGPPAIGRTWADLVAGVLSPRGAIALAVVAVLLVAFAHWQAAPGSNVALFGLPLWQKAAAAPTANRADAGVSQLPPAPAPDQRSKLVVPTTFFESACEYPKAPPEPPDGLVATREAMLAGKSLVVKYNTSMEAYLACFQKEFDDKLGRQSNVTAELKTEVTRMHDQKHNAAVDELQGVADRFNAQLLRFKARTAGQ